MTKNEIRLIHNREMLKITRERYAEYARQLRTQKISAYERTILSVMIFNEKQEMKEIKERISRLERSVK